MSRPITPVLAAQQIQDIYIRKNFEQLTQYFTQQNQLLDFKFFEQDFAAAGDAQIAHGLNYIPQDVIVTKVTGPGIVSFNHGEFTTSTISLSATDACRVRFFVGSYWNDKSSTQNKSGDLSQYSSTVPNSSGGNSLVFRAPTIKTFVSGSGIYKPSAGILYFRVKMVGAGGGGGGSGNTSGPTAGSGTSGTSTTFNSLTAGGGAFGTGSQSNGAGAEGGLGGTPLGVDSSMIYFNGQDGQSALTMSTGTGYWIGGGGGNSFFGGGGNANKSLTQGAAKANTGSGGAGAASPGNGYAGAGGGAGAYIEALFTYAVGQSFPFSIGVKGNGGSAGTGGNVGWAGADGFIIIEEFSQ